MDSAETSAMAHGVDGARTRLPEAMGPEAAGPEAAGPVDGADASWLWGLRIAWRIVLPFAAIDASFKVLIVPAYLRLVGARPGVSEARVVGLAVGLAVILDLAWLVALRRLVAPVERWIRADLRGGASAAFMTSAGAALHRMPMRSALLWASEWLVFFVTYTALVGDCSAPAPLGLFLATMVLGPLPLAHTFTVWLSLPEVRRLSLTARRQNVTLRLRSTPLWGRLMLYTLALALAPAFYMATAVLSTHAQQMSAGGRAVMVALCFAAIALFGVLCALLFAATITQPIATMANIIREIARQGDASSVGRLPQERGDEIGVLVEHTNRMIDRLEDAEAARAAATESLAALNRSLEERVRERTIKLTRAYDSLAREMDGRAAANAQMRLVLDHVGQGFLCVDRAGLVSGELSAAAEAWFGPAAPGVPVWEYFRAKDARFATWLEVSWTALVADVLPVELLLAQMPDRLAFAARVYGVAYRGVVAGEQLSRVVLVVTDITTLVESERAEAANRELATMLDQLIRDRAGVCQFVEEAAEIVAQLSAAGAPVRRLIHTLKGGCAAYAIRSVADACQVAEDALEGSTRNPTADEIASIRGPWEAFFARVSALVRIEASVVEITDSELLALRDVVRQRGPYGAIERRVAELRYEPASRALARAAAQAVALARRLGKGRLETTIDADDLRVAPERWSELWAAFLHAVRNAVDHGIEAPEERVATGKSAAGHLVFGARSDGAVLTIDVRDDGRGIDWAKVAERARDAGLPHATPADLQAALFADGLSTRDVVTETSGRGVGMSALLEAAQRLGGTVEIESRAGKGTLLRIRVPASARTSIHPPA